MGCCIDVGHTVRTGADVVQAMREAGPRLFNVHMKDLARLQEQGKPGCGRGRSHARAGNVRRVDRDAVPGLP
jgi:sugar phosphate isomerase/epimerase